MINKFNDTWRHPLNKKFRNNRVLEMNYYYCSSCNKRIELKYKTIHLESELHINTEGTVINKYTIMNPKFCEISNILKNNVNNCDKRFELYKNVCKWKLVFNIGISIDVKPIVMYRISVFRNDLENYLKNKIKYYRLQGLELSYIAELSFYFYNRLRF